MGGVGYAAGYAKEASNEFFRKVSGVPSSTPVHTSWLLSGLFFQLICEDFYLLANRIFCAISRLITLTAYITVE